MGDVWVAKNQRTGADLAIKTLLPSASNAVRTERLRQEAKLASTLSHRNIVRGFDLVEEPDGTLGLVMELLRGQALSTVMRSQGTLTPVQAAAVVVPVLLALQHAHDVGIVHRDVKPGNVFLIGEPDGAVVPKLLDFGIAKVPAHGSSLTLDPEVLGTPRYMSPEQIRSKGEIDGRSDQFGIAVLLYELLTGSTPFLAATPSATLAAVLEQEVDPDPRIDPRVWMVIQRALAKRPYERFGAAKEMAKALCDAVSATEETLQAAIRDLKPALRTVPPPVLPDLDVSPQPARSARPPVALAIAAVAFAVFGVGVFGYALAVRTMGDGATPSRETVVVDAPARRAEPPALASAAIPPPNRRSCPVALGARGGAARRPAGAVEGRRAVTDAADGARHDGRAPGDDPRGPSRRDAPGLLRLSARSPPRRARSPRRRRRGRASHVVGAAMRANRSSSTARRIPSGPLRGAGRSARARSPAGARRPGARGGRGRHPRRGRRRDRPRRDGRRRRIAA